MLAPKYMSLPRVQPNICDVGCQVFSIVSTSYIFDGRLVDCALLMQGRDLCHEGADPPALVPGVEKGIYRRNPSEQR